MRFHEQREFFNRKNPDPCVINGRRYIEGFETTIRTVEEYPYSYSPFYVGQSAQFTDLKPKAVWNYDDRMRMWDLEKYKEAHAKATAGIERYSNFNRFEYWTETQWDVFVKAYFGEHHKWVATANGRNIATGYDYYVIMTYVAEIHEEEKP